MNFPLKKRDAVEIDAWFLGRAKEGLLIDQDSGSVLLKWPRDVAKFPYGVAWIELRRGEVMVGQGPMLVRLNRRETHYVGRVRLADLGLLPQEIDGVSPEAWAVWEEDVAAFPPQAFDQLSRLLASQGDGTGNEIGEPHGR